jgi:hypothetical protein
MSKERIVKRPNSKALRRQFKHLACSRCGHLQNIELHHKHHFIDGGSNTRENLIPLCKNCHDFQHAKENILKAINVEMKRLAILQERLRILERENAPETIVKRGYQTYFTFCTDILPQRTICGKR